MDIEYFGSIEGVLVIDDNLEIIHFMFNVCFYLNDDINYKEGESS